MYFAYELSNEIIIMYTLKVYLRLNLIEQKKMNSYLEKKLSQFICIETLQLPYFYMIMI